jgi:histidinol-phosphatase (PHP family)
VHYIVHPNGAKPFIVDGSQEEFINGLNEAFGGDAQALMHYYYDTLKEMITIGGFDILGHADLIKKNCQGKNYWTEESESFRQREIAHTAAQAGIVAEVNTGGINRKKTHDVYPSLSFLRFFREFNVPVIITADAHRAEDIDGNYDIALQTLNCADFKNHVLFYGKNNRKAIWQKEKICHKRLD